AIADDLCRRDRSAKGDLPREGCGLRIEGLSGGVPQPVVAGALRRGLLSGSLDGGLWLLLESFFRRASSSTTRWLSVSYSAISRALASSNFSQLALLPAVVISHVTGPIAQDCDPPFAP